MRSLPLSRKLSRGELARVIALALTCGVWFALPVLAADLTPMTLTQPVQVVPNAVSPSRAMRLSDTFDRANQYNKEVITAKYNLPAAKAAVKIAGAIPNPKFNLQYGFGPAFTIIIAGNPQQFGLAEEIQTAGKRTKKIHVARANLGLAELQVAALQFDVHNRVRRAYAELSAAEAYATLVESERKAANDLLSTADKRFEAGKVAKSESLLAELGVLQFDTQRIQAASRLQKASTALGLLLGETPSQVETIDVDDNGVFKLTAEKSELVPPPTRDLPPLDTLLPLAVERRPDLHVAIQQAYSDRKALTLAKTKKIPDLFFEMGYQFTTFRRTQPYQLDTGITPTEQGCYINVSSEIPILYWYQGEVNQARITWWQDQEQIDQMKLQIGTDLVQAYEALQVSRANIVKYQQRLIPSAATVARLARRSYEVGKTGLSEAILAKQQYQQTLSSYFDTVVTYQNAWADLEKAVGLPLQM